MKVDLEELEDVARMTAEKSTCRYKVACLLVDNKGKIVATGYNHRIRGKRLGKWSCHAEMDALNKVMKPSPNLTAFIYRMNSNPINPCKACQAVLKAYRVRAVYCMSGIDGWIKEDI